MSTLFFILEKCFIDNQILLSLNINIL